MKGWGEGYKEDGFFTDVKLRSNIRSSRTGSVSDHQPAEGHGYDLHLKTMLP